MNKTVLVVDDERDTEYMFELYFKKDIELGELQFVYVYSAEEAITYLQQLISPILCVLTDIRMKDMSGIELLQYIEQNYKYLPVIVITAYDDTQNRFDAYKYGACGYINKPIVFETLKNMLYLLKRRKTDV